MSRVKKNWEDVDTSRFEPLIEEALKAFGVRFHYALNMLDRASVIKSKREKSRLRKEGSQED